MDIQFTEAWYSPKSKQLVLFLCKEPPKPSSIVIVQVLQLDKCFVPDVLLFFFLVSCQASEDVKNRRRQQGFVDFLDVYLKYYAVTAKRSTSFS